MEFVQISNELCSLFVMSCPLFVNDSDREMQNFGNFIISWTKLVRVNPRACKVQLPHRVLGLTNFLDMLW